MAGKEPTPGNVKAFEELRLGDLRGRDVSRDVVVIPVAPCENHGAHLPTGTDLYVSDDLSERVARKYAASRPDGHVLVYPCIPIGSAAIRGTGSVKITSRQLRRSLIFLCGRFMRQGYRRFVLISVHGGVPFAGALDAVCRALNSKGARAVAPTAAIAIRCYRGDYNERIRAAGVMISDEMRGLFIQDLHGGFLETSMMLAIRPDLVGDRYQTQPPIIAKRRWWISILEKAVVSAARVMPISQETKEAVALGARVGAIDFSWIVTGRLDGYHGAPALASAELGHALLESVSADIAASIDQVFEGKTDPEAFRSAAWLFSWAKGIAACVGVLILALIFLSLR